MYKEECVVWWYCIPLDDLLGVWYCCILGVLSGAGSPME